MDNNETLNDEKITLLKKALEMLTTSDEPILSQEGITDDVFKNFVGLINIIIDKYTEYKDRNSELEARIKDIDESDLKKEVADKRFVDGPLKPNSNAINSAKNKGTAMINSAKNKGTAMINYAKNTVDKITERIGREYKEKLLTAIQVLIDDDSCESIKAIDTQLNNYKEFCESGKEKLTGDLIKTTYTGFDAGLREIIFNCGDDTKPSANLVLADYENRASKILSYSQRAKAFTRKNVGNGLKNINTTLKQRIYGDKSPDSGDTSPYSTVKPIGFNDTINDKLVLKEFSIINNNNNTDFVSIVVEHDEITINGKLLTDNKLEQWNTARQNILGMEEQSGISLPTFDGKIEFNVYPNGKLTIQINDGRVVYINNKTELEAFRTSLVKKPLDKPSMLYKPLNAIKSLFGSDTKTSQLADHDNKVKIRDDEEEADFNNSDEYNNDNENYNRNSRRGVFVNLVGNSSPSATTEITTIINRLRREGWTLGLQA